MDSEINISDYKTYTNTELFNFSLKELFPIGTHLILKLNYDQTFEGDVIQIGKDHIELTNVKEHGNINKLTNNYIFYRNEIEKILKLLTDCEDNIKYSTDDDNDGNKNGITMDENEYKRLKEMSKDYEYVEEYDEKFDKIIEEISEYESIGVAILHNNNGRKSTVGLIVISTWKKVYLIDMIKLNKIHSTLLEIFQTENVCKIMHNSAPSREILLNYNANFENVYDTCIVDLIIQKNKPNGKLPHYLRNVSECLEHFYNFPQSLFEHALKTNAEKWIKRPLSERRMWYASQMATYLITLRDQMNKIIFSDVNRTFDKVYDYAYNLDGYKFKEVMCQTTVNKEIDDLIPVLTRHSIQKK